MSLMGMVKFPHGMGAPHAFQQNDGAKHHAQTHIRAPAAALRLRPSPAWSFLSRESHVEIGAAGR